MEDLVRLSFKKETIFIFSWSFFIVQEKVVQENDRVRDTGL